MAGKVSIAAIAVALAVAGPIRAEARIAPKSIVMMDISELRIALDRGDVTAVEITNAYLAEIDRNDKKGKKLNAIARLNPQALEQAKAWDDALKRHDLKWSPFLRQRFKLWSESG